MFIFPLQEHFILENPDWKYDIMPEIMDGKNVGDFIDKDILQKLEKLEREEEKLFGLSINEELDEEIAPELLQAAKGIHSKRALLKIEHKLKRKKRVFPRS